MRVVGFLILAIGLLSVPAFLREPDKPAAPAKVAAVPPPFELPLSDRVDLSKFVWARVGFKTVAEASFVLLNRNDRPVRDVVVSCDFLGNSGTKISTARRTIYETIAPGKSLPVKEIGFGFIDQQVAKVSCTVARAERA